jgi:RND superfamily putative drug exporter
VGGITILGAFLGLRIATGLVPLSIFALNLITGMGLGLAIDYSLFMVSRYREELAAGHSVGAALRRTMSTSGRTILFSSLTVAAAMASLLVFPERFLYSMGIGGVITSLTACAVALLVLPAVLRLLGHRVNALAPRRWQQPLEAEAGFWAALARRVMARPVLAAAASGALLLSLGLPFLGVKFTSVDTNVLPAKYSSRQVAEALDSDFSQNPAPSLYAVFEGGAVTGQEVKAFADRVQGLGEVKSVSVRQAGATAWEVDVQARHGVYSDQVRELVSSIRGLGADHPYLVGGRAATFVDLQSSLLDHLPLALGIVACATIVILFLMTGSVLLPLKSVLMNIVTLSAAMGILVLVFQDGNLTGLLRFTRQGALESTQPVLLFAIVFGLSTDYGVFLLSRIKELRDSGLSNRESVVRGLGRTGRIVSAAALLFCVAIGAFATSEIVFIKELGVGTAIGVLLDATIVRGLLVPALMRLLGGWNWWAPSPLRWLHERLGLRESSAPAAT